MEQINNSLPFNFFFTELGRGKTGLTVTIDVYKNGTEIVSAGSVTERGDGLYDYTLSSGSVDAEGVYVGIAKTATTTVDQMHLAQGFWVGKGGVENLDAAVSSRLATTGYTAPDNSSITAIKAKTDNLPIDPADQSAVEAAITAAASSLATAANLAIVDGVVDAIKLKTDNLPSDPADQSLLDAAIDALPTAAEIDTQLSGTHGAGSWLSGSGGGGGSGAISTTVTITVSGLPRDGVEVWATTDSGGLNVAASGTTDAMGQVTFMLDAGTYYLWKQLSGVNFTNPETMVVS